MRTKRKMGTSPGIMRTKTVHTKAKTKHQIRLAEYERIKKDWRANIRNRVCRFPKCWEAAAKSPHHKRGRLGALLCDTRFWIPLCRKHHSWVHANIAEARKLDLIAQPGEWNTQPKIGNRKPEVGRNNAPDNT